MRILAAAILGFFVGAALASVLDLLYTGTSLKAGLRSPISRTGLLAPAAALVYALAAYRAIDGRQLVLVAVVSTILLALTATDLQRHLLPDRIVYPALVLAIAVSWLWPGRPAWSSIAGGFAGLVVMLLIFLILPGFGFGDVKLAGLIGLIIGFPAVFTALAFGALLGGLGAAFLLVSGRAGLRTAIAYGPYLATGAIVELLLRR